MVEEDKTTTPTVAEEAAQPPSPSAPEQPSSAADAEWGNATTKKETTNTTTDAGTRRKRSVLWILVAVAVLCLIALVVGLSVGLTDRKDGNSSSSMKDDDGDGDDNDGDDGDDGNGAGIEPGDDDDMDEDDGGKKFYSSKSAGVGLLDFRLPLLSKSTFARSLDDDELRENFEQFATFLAHVTVQTDKGTPEYSMCRRGGMGIGGAILVGGEEEELAMITETTDDAASSSSSSKVEGPSAGGADSYETNNQEDGVDEADLAKSDGTFVFAAYGDILVVWEAQTGEWVTNVTMPPIVQYVDDEKTTTTTSVMNTNTNATANATDSDSSSDSDVEMKSLWLPPYRRRAQIRALLLHSERPATRLVVIVHGYGHGRRTELGYTPVLNDLLSTHIRIYDLSKLGTEGTLALLREVDVNGNYQSGRMIGGDVHLVTGSWLNTWDMLVGPLRRYQSPYEGLDDDEYEAKASELAEDELVPEFARRLLEDISVHGSHRVAPMALPQSELDGATSGGGVIDFLYCDGAANFYTQITSFHVDVEAGDDDGDDHDHPLALSITGGFSTDSWGHTYAASDLLIQAIQGWNWDPVEDRSLQYTYLMAFDLSNGTAVPAGVGRLPGYLVNEYAIDFNDDHIFMATTVRHSWRGQIRQNQTSATPNGTENRIVSLRIERSDDGAFGSIENVGDTGTFGLPFEVITTVRFFDRKAYAVTFERTDPFYTIDLSDPSSPRVVGELKVTGFSSYMHSINHDDTLLLAVGEDADLQGRTLGMQISLFNASNMSHPTLVTREAIETDPDAWSSSDVMWDFKAFRYVPLAAGEHGEEEGTGILIIPLRIRTYQIPLRDGNFDGYVVYNVNSTSIQERFRISHVNSRDFYGCYYPAMLPERSFVFDGNVTTLKGHSVIHTDLDYGTMTWNLTLPPPEDRHDCVYWILE